MDNNKAVPGSWPPPFTVEPKSSHTHTFILLHGLGSNDEKFGRELLSNGTSSAGQTLATAYPGAKFVFPKVKRRRCTALSRTVLTMWFDFYSLADRTAREEMQIDGLAESVGYVRSIIAEEMKAVAAENIVLGGLSQGCATGLVALLSLEFSVGAFVGMSGRLPFRRDIDDIINSPEAQEDGIQFGNEEQAEEVSPAVQSLAFVRDLLALDAVEAKELESRNALASPIFISHGAEDDKVPCSLGEQAARTLSSLGMGVAWKKYPELGHWYKVPEEIDDILTFLQEHLA